MNLYLKPSRGDILCAEPLIIFLRLAVKKCLFYTERIFGGRSEYTVLPATDPSLRVLTSPVTDFRGLSA
jgi:hypothetical protein